MPDPSNPQADARAGSGITLSAHEAWLIYRALGPTGKAPNSMDRFAYVRAVQKLKAAAQEASP